MYVKFSSLSLYFFFFFLSLFYYIVVIECTSHDFDPFAVVKACFMAQRAACLGKWSRCVYLRTLLTLLLSVVFCRRLSGLCGAYCCSLPFHHDLGLVLSFIKRGLLNSPVSCLVLSLCFMYWNFMCGAYIVYDYFILLLQKKFLSFSSNCFVLKST